MLEVSIGTGWLMSRYAGRVEATGVDLNPEMIAIARRNLNRAGVRAELRQADVESLPFADEQFDTVVNTMSFSGYPDAARAMSEMRRVLHPGGRLVLIDVNYPSDGNRLGAALVGMWKRSGDLIRAVDRLLAAFGFQVREREIGGWGSVHLYIAAKPERAEP